MDDNWELMKEGQKGTPLFDRWLIDNVPFGGKVGVDLLHYSLGLFNSFYFYPLKGAILFLLFSRIF